MGTTRTALEAGSSNWVYVVAIEGFSSLITNGSTAAAVTAWAGTDFVTAIDGLHVDLSMDQRLDPDSPIGGMGTCTLWIQDELDVFGVALNKKSGAETYLETTLDRDDTTVEVSSTADFAASGVAYIGTEAIAYTGKTASPAFLTGCTRGKYSPFAAGGSETARFAHEHRVALDSNSVKLQPKVSQLPRSWRGKFVGIWIHRVVAGVLDVKAQAECVFAGIFGDHRDDANTGATVVQLQSISDWVGDRVLGSGQWEASIGDGVYLEVGQGFALSDGNSSLTDTANELIVVAPGSFTGANYMPAGVWSLADLCSKINEWLASEHAAARINFTYSIRSPFRLGPENPYRTMMFSFWASSGMWRFIMPTSVAKFLGYVDDTGTSAGTSSIPSTQGIINSVGGYACWSQFSPLQVSAPLDGGTQAVIKVTTTSGEFSDQRGTMPYSVRPTNALGLEWGLFIVGDSQLILAAKEGDYLTHMQQWSGLSNLSVSANNIDPHVSFAADGGRAPRVRQILAIEYECATALALLFMSTGTLGYNESFLDILPRGLSLGVPLELLGDDFVAEIPGTAGSVAIIIDKPKKFREVVDSDLVIRWAYMRWVSGTLRFGAWRSPSSINATSTLDDTNKAESSDVKSPQRSATEESNEWQKSIVKIEYNRDVTKLGDGGDYQSSLIFEDRVAVDDQGGAGKVHTISLANTFTDFAATGQSAESLLPVYLANMPLISRPARRVDRSIDPTHYWKIGVGDTVLVSDLFARDPATGLRGLAIRPALVVKHTFRLGGMTSPGLDKPEPMGGRVTLFFTDSESDRTGIRYAPAADVDYSATTGGYDAGYSVGDLSIRCLASNYSHTTEAADASHFVAGHKIKIIERDPIDLTNPVIWERIVASQTGNDIILTAALSSPAWDNTKKYRVVFDDYDAIVSAQQAWTFNASSVDGLILDVTQPYLYGSGTPPGAYEANPVKSAQELVELIPDIIPLDGAGRDVGYDKQIARLADALIDYKTTSSPYLFNEVLTNTAYVAGYQLVAATPLYLMWESLNGTTRRELSVAPMFRSSDGTPVFIRISIYRNVPHDTYINDQSPGIIYDGVVFETTSTTWQIPSPDVLFAEIKDVLGGCWLQIECSYKCETRGLARLVEGPRLT